MPVCEHLDPQVIFVSSDLRLAKILDLPPTRPTPMLERIYITRVLPLLELP